MNRRRFIVSAVALAAASRLQLGGVHLSPAVPVLYGDGYHDDTAAMQAWGSGRPWRHADGRPGGKRVDGQSLLISETILVTAAGGDGLILSNCFIRMAAGFRPAPASWPGLTA